MMANSGEELESLVKEIEQHLLPEGFTISSREKTFDESGTQLAEFDIIVEGNVGSRIHKWLIECRDRPSEGAAPGSWIEQLHGRRERFQFDAVMAVSTTGFSSSAVSAAERFGIDLREVQSLDVNSIRRWFALKTSVAVFLRSELVEAEVYYDSGGREDVSAWVTTHLHNTPFVKPMLVAPGGVTMSVLQVSQALLRHRPDLYLGLKANESHTTIDTAAVFKGEQDLYIDTPYGQVPVPEARFRMHLWIEEKPLDMDRVSGYLKAPDGETVAQSVCLPFETADHRFEIRFLNFGEDHKTLLKCQVTRLETIAKVKEE